MSVQIKLTKKEIHDLESLKMRGSLSLRKYNRKPIAAKSGSLEKYDYEYKRKGTCNIFWQ